MFMKFGFEEEGAEMEQIANKLAEDGPALWKFLCCEHEKNPARVEETLVNLLATEFIYPAANVQTGGTMALPMALPPAMKDFRALLVAGLKAQAIAHWASSPAKTDWDQTEAQQ